LKVADTLKYNYSILYPAGTRVIYDTIRADADSEGGIMVRVVDPFRRPVWLSAIWLESYRYLKDEGKVKEAL
jgi:hypothetical protein